MDLPDSLLVSLQDIVEYYWSGEVEGFINFVDDNPGLYGLEEAETEDIFDRYYIKQDIQFIVDIALKDKNRTHVFTDICLLEKAICEMQNTNKNTGSE